MSNELTVIKQSQLNPDALTPAVPQGLGMDFGSSTIFEFKPSTLSINQESSSYEGKILGKFRIDESGEQFDNVRMVLLMKPEQARSYYIGERGQMNRKKENLMCFARNIDRTKNPDGSKYIVRPSEKAKDPQAITCATCPKADWKPYRAFKERNPHAPVPSQLLPSCEPYYFFVGVAAEYNLPLQMWVRGKSMAPFKQAMENLGKKYMSEKAKNARLPNIFDISFNLKLKGIPNPKKAGGTIYVLDIPGTSFQLIDNDSKVQFGTLFTEFVESQKQRTDDALDAVEQESINQQQKTVDNAVDMIQDDDIPF